MISLLINLAFAGCDYKVDIKQNEQGEYVYSRDCHIEVGKQIKELDLRVEQVSKLEKSLELKDLALTSSEKRADLWMNTSLKLEDNISKIERHTTAINTIYFVGGVGLTVLAIWGASALGKAYIRN